MYREFASALYDWGNTSQAGLNAVIRVNESISTTWSTSPSGTGLNGGSGGSSSGGGSGQPMQAIYRGRSLTVKLSLINMPCLLSGGHLCS